MALQIFDGLLVYVDTVSDQDVGGVKTFLARLASRAGSNALTMRPPAGEGESPTLYQRRPKGSTPHHGDAWSIGVVENFEVVSRGNGTNTVRLRISPRGEVRVGDGGSFFSPTINTATLKISDKDVFEIFQRKLTAIDTNTPLLVGATTETPKLRALAAGTSIP